MEQVIRCPVCNNPIPDRYKGRIRTYDTPECKELAKKARKQGIDPKLLLVTISE